MYSPQNIFLKIRNRMDSGYTPRWLIFALDLSALFVAFLLMAFLREAIFRDLGFEDMFFFRLITVIGCGSFYSVLFGTYTGVVRYSGTWDMLRVGLYNLCLLSTLIIINLFFDIIDKPQPFNYFMVSMMVVLTFCFMITLRLSVKMMFSIWGNMEKPNKAEKVFVLGGDADSLLLVSALKEESSAPYLPVGIVDLKNKNTIKTIMNIPIYGFSRDLLSLLDSYKVKTVVVLPKHLPSLKETIMNELVEAGIRVLVVNRFHDINSKDKVSTHVRQVRIEDLLGRPPIKIEDKKLQLSINGNVILVTGAAGSIGSEICRQVASLSPKFLVLVDQAETPMYNIELELKNDYPNLNFISIIAGVTNEKRMKEVFETYSPKIVYHAAAYKHVPMMENNPIEAIRVNVGGTRLLANLSQNYNVDRFIMISTDKAVNPTNIMGASKRIAEIYVQSFFHYNSSDTKTKFITTRFGNVLGSNGSVVPLFKSQIEKGGPITITHRDIIRYFMTIPEACNLVLEASVLGNGGEIFVFDMGEPVKIYDLAKKMIKLSGLIPDVDIKIVEIGLRPGEKLYEELLSDKEKDLPTPNEKIRIADVRRYDYKEVDEKIKNLISIAKQGEVFEAVEQMKIIVPEFKSKNSRFEKVDSLLNAK
ncbi:MAG: nucleoside-diphosphate sugar epimerase/dehydratase [Bacteroidales bacterium]|nr:nucleoside-diphosphate sugar epimerase/dehydratase [Bacteroidales bacterium]